MMKRKYIRIFLAVISAVILLPQLGISAVNEQGASVNSQEIPYSSYTYWEGINAEKKAVYAKPMYDFEKFISSRDIGGSNDSSIKDLAVGQDKIYVLDSGLGKVYVLDTDYHYIKTIENISYHGETLNFEGACGIYADSRGAVYIADTGHQRVIVTDLSAEVKNILLLPDSSLIPTDFLYKPVKVAVDGNGYIYIVSEGAYYGAILYSPEMEFLGFFGANSVKGTIKTFLTNIWNKLFSNDQKRAADELSLPYTITDITIGPDNFVYTATGRAADKDSVQTGQICMFNPGGTEVLKAADFNFADSKTGKFEKQPVMQNISGVAVDNDGYMYILDITYGRIFIYDGEMNILSAFGGSINITEQKGMFKSANAIELCGKDIIVSDMQKNGISVFKITPYGELVKQADTLTLNGEFLQSLDLWENILNEDRNNQLAYRGIAKAMYDKGEYEEALHYSKVGYDRETYGKAFKNIRNIWLEKHFFIIFTVFVILIAGICLFAGYKKKKGIILFKSLKIKTFLSCTAHPVDSFREIKEKKVGSVTISVILMLSLYVITVLSDMAGGFIYTSYDPDSYNSLYVLFSTVGLVLLGTASNWLVCTLLGGIGKLKEIYIVICYSLIPAILAYVLKLVLSNVLVKDESTFVGIIMTALFLYAVFMLIVGLMRIHDYEFGRFLFTMALTLCVMVIIIFLIFLVFMLAQQVYGWIATIVVELSH